MTKLICYRHILKKKKIHTQLTTQTKCYWDYRLSVASLACCVCLMVSCVLHFWRLFGRDLFRWTLRCKHSLCTAIGSEIKGRKRLVRLYRYLEHLSNGFSSLWADFIVPKAQCCEACVCLSVAWNKDEIRTMLEDWHWEIKGKKKILHTQLTTKTKCYWDVSSILFDTCFGDGV